jgi:hypothetical protein
MKQHTNPRKASSHSPSSPASAPPKASPDDPKTILVVGGIGRMEPRYREALAAKGYDLLYYEKRLNAGNTLAAALAAVLVITTVISHPLKDQAQKLAQSNDIPLLYVREPSVSSIRRAIDDIPADPTPAPEPTRAHKRT